MSLFESDEHQTKFENLQINNWYDPNTRDEIFVCKLLNDYKKNLQTFCYILAKIPITNNVFYCLYQLEHENDADNDIKSNIRNCFEKLPISRMEELTNFVKMLK